MKTFKMQYKVKMMFHKVFLRPYLVTVSDRSRDSFPMLVLTAASLMSTLVQAVLKLVVLLVARKKLAEDEKQDLIHGKPICGVKLVL